MTKRLAALIFIFGCTSLAWIILGSTIFSRTYSSGEKLSSKVGSTWGTPQEQVPPIAVYTTAETKSYNAEENGRTIAKTYEDKTDHTLSPDSSNIDVVLNLAHRQKGLLWYSTYAVKFAGEYAFHNPTGSDQLTTFRLKFPAEKAIYDDVIVRIDGQQVPTSNDNGSIVAQTNVPAGKTITMQIGYRSQGMDSWQYKLGSDVAQAKNFTLNMHTNFRDIDFAENTLSPTEKRQTAGGWDLTWKYSDLISG
ncbi:MAG TPA: inner membrane CreD family protein, partial [Terriglobales bacterium]|nr:inner membrane CreD family protein [Terriglobales bacterium]